MSPLDPDFKKKLCFRRLSFLGAEQGESLQIWRNVTQKATKTIFDNVLKDIESYAFKNLSLSSLYSFISVMAILVSEEFDSYITALVDDEWIDFDKFHTKEKHYCLNESLNWEEHRLIELEYILMRLHLEWDAAYRGWQEAPVRELEIWEKKQWCEEVELPPRSLTDREDNTANNLNIHKKTNLIHHNRLHISVDPFTAPGIVAEMVKSFVENRQKEYLEEVEYSWQNEIRSQAVSEEFVKRELEKTKNIFTLRKNFSGNKRKYNNTLSMWIISLNVYNLKRLGKSSEYITQQKWWKIGSSNATISKYKDRAKKIIAAALQGVHLGSIDVKPYQ